MQGKTHLSSTATIFLAKLKYFLDSNAVSLQQFIKKNKDLDQKQLSRHDFINVIHKGNFNVKPNHIFKQLSGQGHAISLSDLSKLMSEVSSMQNQNFQIRKKQKKKQKDHKNKLARKALFLLGKYISKLHDPVAFLHKFDLDNNDSIDKVEFTKLLIAIATEIKAFNFKQIRKQVVQSIYNQFKTEEIECNKLCDYFRIKQNKSVQKNTKGLLPIIPIQIQEQQIILQQKQDFNDISRGQQNHSSSMQYYQLEGPQIFQYKAIEDLQNLIQKNLSFIDRKNPRSGKGIYLPASKICNNQQYRIFQSSKSSLMQSEKIKDLVNKISSNWIVQGRSQNCYFISSIASVLSKHQSVIIQLFLFKKNPYNFYAVKLCIDGQWKVINTDDHFPCQENNPIYASSKKNQIWAMLLEKVWAKQFGSYQAIKKGTSSEAFTALTGAPCQILQISKYGDQKEFIKKLKNIHKNKYVTNAHSKPDESVQKQGIIKDHSYSFFYVIEIHGYHLAYLRNPWGKVAWEGEWSVGSQKWKNYLKGLHNNPQEGCFYMSLVDFRKYFKQINICKINPDFVHDSFRVKTNQHKSAYFSMQVEQNGRYTISVYQPNKRKINSKQYNQQYKYCQARIIILKKIGKQMQYVGSRVTLGEYACSFEAELQEGDYVISAKVFWTIWQQNQLVLTSYGPKRVQLMPINRSIAPQFKMWMVKSFSIKFDKKGGSKNKYKQEGAKVKQTINFDHRETGIGYIKVFNKSDKECKYMLQATLIQNVKMIKPAKLPLLFRIKPQQQKVFGLFINYKSQFKYKTIISLQ